MVQHAQTDDDIRNMGSVLVPLRPICAAEMLQKPAPKIPWLVEGIIPMHQVTMLSGQGSAGKSSLAMTLMAAISSGQNWLGREVERGAALGIFCEDADVVLHGRMERIQDACNYSHEDLAEMHVLSREANENLMITFANKWDRSGTLQPFFQQVKTIAQQLDTRLIVLDNLYNIFGGDENDRPHAFRTINALKELARDCNSAVLLCAHPSRSGMADNSGMAGVTAWHDSVRARYYLRHDEDYEGDKQRMVLECKKNNYGPEPDAIRLKKEYGIPVPVDPLGLETGMTGQIIKNNIRRVFVEAFKRWDDLGLGNLSMKSRAANYAPKALYDYQVGHKYEVHKLTQAMHKLIQDGVLIVTPQTDKYGREFDALALTATEIKDDE